MVIQEQPSEWTKLASTPTTSPAGPAHFHEVVMTLLHSPNITSSLLFRAEIYYDSDADAGVQYDSEEGLQDSLTLRHLKAELRPRRVSDRSMAIEALPDIDGRTFVWQRTVVRNLVPRNPARDKALVQSCWYFVSASSNAEANATEQQAQPLRSSRLVVYVPHVANEEDIPYYHPAVRALAILYTHGDVTSVATDQSPPVEADSSDRSGTVQVFCHRFDDSVEAPLRLGRTGLNMATIIAKHMLGRANGYEKRVHHDQIIPQKAFQDTYTRLKLKYAKDITKIWVEQTDPTKHVFEDLGIAAFLIELWNEMYKRRGLNFPGFIDVGCGNGLLVYLLRSEGYEGWGFDIVARKTWDALPQDVVRGYLLEKICVPKVLIHSLPPDHHILATIRDEIHDGTVPQGTFIISNHADELTVWTPLLAHVSQSPFIAIPCCSHDFAGSKFRARAIKREDPDPATHDEDGHILVDDVQKRAGVETGTLRKRNPKQPSAYDALCSYLAFLTEEIGLVPEKEMLRIPSTRNAAILGRTAKDILEQNSRKVGSQNDDSQAQDKESMLEGRENLVRSILDREMGALGLSSIATAWIEHAYKATKHSKRSH